MTIFIGFLLIILSVQATADTQSSGFQTLNGLFEPSGAVQLSDGRILAVEDEPVNPFVLLTPKIDTESFDVSHVQATILSYQAMGNVSDLEGVTRDPEGTLYAITSHSRKSTGKRNRKREKLIQFSLDGNRLIDSEVRGDFRKGLLNAFPSLKKAAKERDVKDQRGFNIEGLTFSPDSNVLWVGLRAPLFNEKAILVALLNPRRALELREAFVFAKYPVYLDLDGGGIRDIAYDPTLSGYLILSQRENTKKEKPFKLWLWNGHTKSLPRRVRIEGIKNLKRTESVAPVRLNGKDQLLLLNDNGNRKSNTSASYVIVDYKQLDIEAAR